MQVCWLISRVGTSQGRVRGGALLSSQANHKFSDGNAALGKHVCRPLATQSKKLRGFLSCAIQGMIPERLVCSVPKNQLQKLSQFGSKIWELSVLRCVQW